MGTEQFVQTHLYWNTVCMCLLVAIAALTSILSLVLLARIANDLNALLAAHSRQTIETRAHWDRTRADYVHLVDALRARRGAAPVPPEAETTRDPGWSSASGQSPAPKQEPPA